MTIVGVVGSSGSGKTRLIERLLAEFMRRGRRTAVLKHRPHGFDLDVTGKDSQRFLDAGAEAVGLASPELAAFLHRQEEGQDLALLAAEQFVQADIVLVEGGRSSRGYPKILVLGPGEPLGQHSGLAEVVAVVSEGKQPCRRPGFAPEEVSAMADFIEQQGTRSPAVVTAEVDGVEVRLSPFVQSVFEKVVLALVTTLKGVPPAPDRVILKLRKLRRSGDVDQRP